MFAIARAEGGLEGPVAGWLIDRYGNRAVLAPSLLLAIAGYFIMAFWMPNFWAFAFVYLGIISIGNSMAMQHACFAGLNQWFHPPPRPRHLHTGRRGLPGRPGPDPDDEPAH